MANVVWPSTLKITEQNITPINPAEFVHAIPQSRTTQVLIGGYGTWIGNTGISHQIDQNEAEAFLAEMSTRDNTTEMPLARPTIASGSSIAITSVVGNLYTLASRPEGLKRDAYVRSGNEVFIIVSATTGANPQISLWPYTPLTTSDTIEDATNMRVRSRGNSPLNRTGQWTFGPYNFQWEQALD